MNPPPPLKLYHAGWCDSYTNIFLRAIGNVTVLKWIYIWKECEQSLLCAIIPIITLSYYKIVMCNFVIREFRTSVRVGQMSMSDKIRPNVRVVQMSVYPDVGQAFENIYSIDGGVHVYFSCLLTFDMPVQ